MNRGFSPRERYLSSASDMDDLVVSEVSSPRLGLSPLSGRTSPTMVSGRKARKHDELRRRQLKEGEDQEGFALHDSRARHSKLKAEIELPDVSEQSPVTRHRQRRLSSSSSSTSTSASSLAELLTKSKYHHLPYYIPCALSQGQWFVDRNLVSVTVPIERVPSSHALPTPPPMSREEEEEEESSSTSESDKSVEVEQEESSSHHPAPSDFHMSVIDEPIKEEEEEEENQSSVSSAAPTEKSEEVDIPELYKKAAEFEEVDLRHLKPFFRETGVRIPYCVSSYKYRKDEIGVIQDVMLKFSAAEPHLTMYNPASETTRLLLPDHGADFVPHVDGLECFKDYIWPADIPQMHELQSKRGVLVSFRNVREPLWLSCDDEETLERIKGALKVARKVARDHAFRMTLLGSSPEEVFHKYPAIQPPSMITAQEKYREAIRKHYPDFDEKQNQFELRLNEAATVLVTTRAVDLFWKNEQHIWVAFWSSAVETYRKKHLRVFIHPFGPQLMVSDRNGSIVKGLLNLHSYSNTRIALHEEPIVPDSVRDLGLTGTVTYIDHLGETTSQKETYFFFDDPQNLRDFQQVAATIAYLQTPENKIMNAD